MLLEVHGQHAKEVDVVQGASPSCHPPFVPTPHPPPFTSPSHALDPPLVMNFLDSTFRDWNVMLEPMAERKPSQVKDSSLVEARATPPMIGKSDSTTGRLGLSPRNIADSSTAEGGGVGLVRVVRAQQGVPWGAWASTGHVRAPRSSHESQQPPPPSSQ